MVVQIPLRKKYLRTWKSRYKGSEHPAKKKGRRNKIGQKAHEDRHGPVQKRTLVVDGRTGKGHMEDQ